MIKFKKNGRPNKNEKKLIKNINSFFSTLSDEEQNSYEFKNEVVNDPKRLESIWDTLNLKNSTNDIEKPKVMAKQENSEPLKFNTDVIEDSAASNEVPSFFNPLDAPIHERNYNKIDTIDVGGIKEPDFQSNSQFDKIDDVPPVLETQEEIDEEEEIKEPSVFENVTNEKVNELDGKEKTLAVKQLVETCLDGYAMLHEIAKMKVVYPEEKLQEKIIAGEIDPSDEIPIDEQGTTVTPVEFIQGFNEQAREAISYDPEFGEKVRPAMERVFAKKGWGMTDEQFLLFCFGKDIAFKGVQVMTLRKTANGIMNTFAEIQQQKMQMQPSEVVRPDTIDRPEPQSQPMDMPTAPPEDHVEEPEIVENNE